MWHSVRLTRTHGHLNQASDLDQGIDERRRIFHGHAEYPDAYRNACHVPPGRVPELQSHEP